MLFMYMYIGNSNDFLYMYKCLKFFKSNYTGTYNHRTCAVSYGKSTFIMVFYIV